MRQNATGEARNANPEKNIASTNSGAATTVAGGFGELHGAVLGANHQPAPDITVELENAGLGFDQNQVSDASGKFEFLKVPAGRDYTLTAFKEGEAQDSHEQITIRSGSRLAIAPLAIESQQEVDLNAHVYGRVLDSGGAPLNGASIKLENPEMTITRGATTDAHGNYSFTEVPPGDGYKISVIRNGNILLVESGVKVDPANINPDQVVILSLKR